MNTEDMVIHLTKHGEEIGSLKHRMSDVEGAVQAQISLARSVDKLATNMEYMCKEQVSQGKRLERLEQAPAEDFKHYKRAIVTAMTGTLIGAVIGALLALIIK
jgi:hypothetical protein